MRCLECQESLQRRLDGQPVPDERAVEQHLAGCASCREEFAAGARLLRGLALQARPSPPPELARRLTAAVLRDREVRRRRVARRLYVTAALAASVLILLLIGYASQPRHTPGPAPHEPVPFVQQPPVPRAPEARHDADTAAAPRPDSLVERTREQLHALIEEITPDVAVGPLPAVAELEPLDPAAQSLRQAGQEVTASLQTVTRSARQALDYFTRELPVPDLGTRE